jgi:hypothetical protein
LGSKVALGAPCFCGGVGDCSGVPVGLGDAVSDGVVDGGGVSNGCAVGEVFFFRCGEGGEEVGDGVGDVDLARLSDGLIPWRARVSPGSGLGEDLFFRCGEALGVGVGDSFSVAAGEDFFFGNALGVGVGDVFFVIEELLFFLGLGVGVGVEKIFLRV